MSPFHWITQTRSLIRRWAPVCLALLALQAESSLALDSESGPASPQEAELLLKSGKDAAEKGRHPSAASFFQRFVDRYPAHPEYTDTLKRLGEARLASSQPQAALEPLKGFVEARGTAESGLEGRLLLGRAYLSTGKLSEALLVSTELLNILIPGGKKEKSAIPAALHAGALLLKAEALLAKKKHSRAKDALSSAEVVLKTAKANSAELLGQARWIDLELKLHACARYPSAKRLQEDQALDQVERRGLCLQEALVQYRSALEPGAEPWVRQSTAAIERAYRSYDDLCRNPPSPVGRRTTVELERYRRELAQRTTQGCSQKYLKSLELLEQAQKALPGSASSSLASARQTISGLLRP